MSKLIMIDGVTRTISDWAKKYGINENTLRNRVEMGWKEDKLLLQAWKANRSQTLTYEENVHGRLHRETMFVGGYDDDFVTANEGEIL